MADHGSGQGPPAPADDKVSKMAALTCQLGLFSCAFSLFSACLVQELTCFTVLAVICGLLAPIVGGMAFKGSQRDRNARRAAVVGIVMGLLAVFIQAASWGAYERIQQSTNVRVRDANNLRQLGIAMHAYQEE